jgi:hypothetical protein
VKGQLPGAFLDGYNATIMAYGQIRFGKTLTMKIDSQLTSISDDLDVDLGNAATGLQGVCCMISENKKMMRIEGSNKRFVRKRFVRKRGFNKWRFKKKDLKVKSLR